MNPIPHSLHKQSEPAHRDDNKDICGWDFKDGRIVQALYKIVPAHTYAEYHQNEGHKQANRITDERAERAASLAEQTGKEVDRNMSLPPQYPGSTQESDVQERVFRQFNDPDLRTVEEVS